MVNESIKQLLSEAQIVVDNFDKGDFISLYLIKKIRTSLK